MSFNSFHSTAVHFSADTSTCSKATSQLPLSARPRVGVSQRGRCDAPVGKRQRFSQRVDPETRAALNRQNDCAEILTAHFKRPLVNTRRVYFSTV